MDDNAEIETILNNIELEINNKEQYDTWADFTSYKQRLTAFDAYIDERRSCLAKVKSAIKAYSRAINSLVETEYALADVLDKASKPFIDTDLYQGLGLLPAILKNNAKFRHKSLSSLNNSMFYPLISFIDSDTKSLADIRKSISDGYRDYKTKTTKFERDLKKLPPDFNSMKEAHEIDCLRRVVYTHICEYFMKYIEMKYKGSHGLVQNSIEYICTILSDYKGLIKDVEGLEKIIDHFNKVESIENRAKFNENHKNIADLKARIKATITQTERTEQQKTETLLSVSTDGSGELKKSGYLLKRGEGFRKAWQRRYCIIEGGVMKVAHDINEVPKLTLNLMTSQVKEIVVDKDQKHFNFTLIACNRQIIFSTESQPETIAWVTVINNAREHQLKEAMSGAHTQQSRKQDPQYETIDLLKEYVKNVPGNEKCADCSADDPEWFSTNLGMLVCIECSGTHREMGVRVSRIRSLSIDILKSWELFLAASLGNYVMNEILDTNPDSHPIINKDSNMEERRQYIHDKYVNKKFMEPVQIDFSEYTYESLLSHDVSSIAYLYMAGYNFVSSESDPYQNSFLHYVIENSNETDLCVVEFLIQNIPAIIDKANMYGDTPLHYSVINKKPNICKILVRNSANIYMTNSKNITPYKLLSESTTHDFKSILDHVLNKRTNKLEISNEVVMAQVDFPGVCLDSSLLKRGNNGSQKSERPVTLRNSILNLRSCRNNSTMSIYKNSSLPADQQDQGQDSIAEPPVVSRLVKADSIDFFRSSSPMHNIDEVSDDRSENDALPPISSEVAGSCQTSSSTNSPVSNKTPPQLAPRSAVGSRSHKIQPSFSDGAKYYSVVIEPPEISDDSIFKAGDKIVVTSNSPSNTSFIAYKVSDESISGEININNVNILRKYE